MYAHWHSAARGGHNSQHRSCSGTRTPLNGVTVTVATGDLPPGPPTHQAVRAFPPWPPRLCRVVTRCRKAPLPAPLLRMPALAPVLVPKTPLPMPMLQRPTPLPTVRSPLPTAPLPLTRLPLPTAPWTQLW